MTEDVHEEDKTLLPKKKKTKLKNRPRDRPDKDDSVACIPGFLPDTLLSPQVTGKNRYRASCLHADACRVVVQRHIFILMQIHTSNWEQKTGSTRDS